MKSSGEYKEIKKIKRILKNKEYFCGEKEGRIGKKTVTQTKSWLKKGNEMRLAHGRKHKHQADRYRIDGYFASIRFYWIQLRIINYIL